MTDRPLPWLTQEPYAAPFWEGTREGELRLQRCSECGRTQFFPRPGCRFCGGSQLEWVTAAGVGTVYAFTVIRRAIEHEFFADDVPYVIGYVNLEEGPRMFTRIVDCAVDEVEVGMPVTVTFHRVADEIVLPLFRPTQQ